MSAKFPGGGGGGAGPYLAQSLLVGILQILRTEFQKSRFLEILNFHPCDMDLLTLCMCSKPDHFESTPLTQSMRHQLL